MGEFLFFQMIRPRENFVALFAAKLLPSNIGELVYLQVRESLVALGAAKQGLSSMGEIVFLQVTGCREILVTLGAPKMLHSCMRGLVYF